MAVVTGGGTAEHSDRRRPEIFPIQPETGTATSQQQKALANLIPPTKQDLRSSLLKLHREEIEHCPRPETANSTQQAARSDPQASLPRRRNLWTRPSNGKIHFSGEISYLENSKVRENEAKRLAPPLESKSRRKIPAKMDDGKLELRGNLWDGNADRKMVSGKKAQAQEEIGRAHV